MAKCIGESEGRGTPTDLIFFNFMRKIFKNIRLTFFCEGGLGGGGGGLVLPPPTKNLQSLPEVEN